MSNNLQKINLHQILDTYIDKYKDNEYVLGRITNYVENLLPSALENDELINKQREERKKHLTTNREEFTSRFMHKNKYYYCSQTELFLLYDGIHFNIYSEDNIQHQILTMITSEQNLMVWKHKIKNNIIKLIKERSPLKAIPESATIQFVINSLYPSIFPTRNNAKYFLTILGDCINANPENSHLIYIISPIVKNILAEISNQTYSLFGLSNILSNIKFKYYEHAYHSCRLISIKDNKDIVSMPPILLKNMLLDVFCVASHYSMRYGSADGFLKQCSETRLVDHALYLHKNTLETIVNNFIMKTITPCLNSKIDNKNMFFLWKKFLDERNVPNIAFHESLKTVFKNILKYNETTDCFLDVTSVHLPLVANFMKFWETTMSEDIYDDDQEPELEIDELTTLFKTFSKNSIGMNINDGVLIELIRHFYPDIMIEDDKYILHVKCNLWNKRLQIINSLYLFKLKCNSQEENMTKSLYEAYEFYSTNNQHPCLASKRYFEKIAATIIAEHIDTDGLITPTWWK